MACGDVLTLEDLQTAKKHQTFEAEVITGKAGGVAGGMPIDYATNQVTGQTQKTLPAVLRDAGFRPAPFTFATGGTLALGDSDMAVLWPVSGGGDGQYYLWKGPYPKIVPAASSPATTGGVSSSGWLPVWDITLRTDLGSNTGAAIVGTSSGLTVQAELTNLKSLVAAATNNDIIIYRPAGVGLDDTVFINNILANHVGIYFEAGIYNIDPGIGIKVKNGSILLGSGFMSTILLAKQVGATLSELAAYSKGSLIKREFNPGVANSYVSGVVIDGFSVIMRHPTTISASNYRQIGIDLRNCDRALVGPNTYVGNTTLPGMPVTWEPPRATQAQGYGIVLGTRNSNLVDYCGGVGCILESPKVYGARKNIAVDEAQLSPQSAAHATIVRSPDLQIGVELISQGSQYNAGTVFEDCLLQSSQRFESSDQTIGLLLSGYNCRGSIRYLEGGPNCDIIAALTSTSADCELDILYASVIDPSAGAIVDNGTNNQMQYKELTSISGGKTTKGRLVETFNRGYKSRRVVSTFVNTIGPQTVTGDSGITVSRTGVGAYTIAVDKAFAGYFGVNISAKTNPSRQGFSFAYSAQASGSVHIDTYVNNSLLDPEQMTIEIFQV